MNVSGFINKMKTKMREIETAKAEKAAKSLKSVRDERIRLEGQKKIYSMEAQERAKISKAKQEIKNLRAEQNPLLRLGKKVSEEIKKNKKNKREAPSFLPSGKDHPLFRK